MTVNKTITFHIGPHKTASTAIQHFLKTHTHFLSEKGYIYPRVFWLNNGHHKLLHFFRNNEKTRILEEIAKIKDKEKNIIISSECISNLTQDNLKLIKDEFSEYEIKIVFYFRTPTERLYSLWQETIKRGDTHSFDKFFDDSIKSGVRNGNINSLLILDKFTHVFGKSHIQIIDYDVAKKAGVINSFLSAVKIKSNKVKEVYANSSLSVLETEQVRRLNIIYDLKGYNEDLTCYKSFIEISNTSLTKIRSLSKKGAFLLYAVNRGLISILCKKQNHVIGNHNLDIRITNIVSSEWGDNVINGITERNVPKSVISYLDNNKSVNFIDKAIYSLLKLPR